MLIHIGNLLGSLGVIMFGLFSIFMFQYLPPYIGVDPLPSIATILPTGLILLGGGLGFIAALRNIIRY